MKTPPLILNHVGITVPDIYAAIDWYGDVFGCTHLMGPRLMSAEGKATAETREVFGTRFERMLQAHLLTGNGVGIELFEPLDPAPHEASREVDYLRPGPWHIALQHPDVDAMVDRIVSKGGHRHSETHAFAPGRPWRLAYTRDPWWTTIEIVSHSYAEMFGNWPQPGAETEPTMVDRSGAERLRATHQKAAAAKTEHRR